MVRRFPIKRPGAYVPCVIGYFDMAFWSRENPLWSLEDNFNIYHGFRREEIVETETSHERNDNLVILVSFIVLLPVDDSV